MKLLITFSSLVFLSAISSAQAGDDAFPYSADPNVAAKQTAGASGQTGPSGGQDERKDSRIKATQQAETASTRTGPSGSSGQADSSKEMPPTCRPHASSLACQGPSGPSGQTGPSGGQDDHGRDNHLGNGDRRDDGTLPPNMHGNHKDVMEGVAPQGHQGIGLGGMVGSATDASKGTAPTAVFEYYNVGANPSEGGRGYGLNQYKVEFSGVDGGMPQMALEMRGMSGWQIIRGSDSHPVMFHLGIEPLNFEGQITSNIVSDARNTAARIAQQNLGQAGQTQQGQQGISQIGNPDAPVLRNQFMYYAPAVSMGIDVRALGCRFLGLVRGGVAGGGQLRTDDGYSYGIDPTYGVGVSANCPQVDVVGEWTRIAQPDAPMDLLNADVMYKPFKKVPLAIGAEFGSTIVDSQDPKAVPVALPAFGAKGASVEEHAAGVLRLVF